MERARRFLRALYLVEAAVCMAAFACVALALMADVLGREFFGNGIFGAQRFAVWSMAIAGLGGFALVTAEGGHLRPRFADGWVPRRLAAHVDRLADLVSASVCIFIGVHAAQFVYSSFELGERGMAIPIEVWPIQLVLPWMFFSSALRFLAHAVWPALRPPPREKQS